MMVGKHQGHRVTVKVGIEQVGMKDILEDTQDKGIGVETIVRLRQVFGMSMGSIMINILITL